MRLSIILFCLILVSCNNREGNIIDVSTLNEKINTSMTKDEVIEKIGLPKDSLIWGDPESSYYYFLYNTNDFSGYTLKIIFDKDDKVRFYRID